MSSPDAPVLTVALAPDKDGPYTPGDALAITVTAHKTATVTVHVDVTLPDGTPGSGEVDIPVRIPAAGLSVSSATDTLADTFTQEQAPDGSVVLRATLGTPAA